MSTLGDGEALYRRLHPARSAPDENGDGPVVSITSAPSQPRGLASGEALYRRRRHEHAGRLVIDREPEPTDVTPGGDAA